MKASRTKAIANGDRYYYTGKECKHGHLSKRTTLDGSCLECRLNRQRIKREEIVQSLNSDKG